MLGFGGLPKASLWTVILILYFIFLIALLKKNPVSKLYLGVSYANTSLALVHINFGMQNEYGSVVGVAWVRRVICIMGFVAGRN